MSLVRSANEAHQFVDMGPTLQATLLPAELGLSTTIAGSGTATSHTFICNGYRNFAFAVTSSQAGNLSIQRYLDSAGTIVQGAAITASLSAATAALVNSNDGKPFQSIIITVTNSSGSSATLTSTMLLLQSY